MKNKTVFLTGAEGFIGSHMVEALVRKNLNVKALVLYNSFKNIGWLSALNKDVLKHVEIIFGDCHLHYVGDRPQNRRRRGQEGDSLAFLAAP